MLDQDISTEAALRLLTAPSADEPGPAGWTRRRFLQAIAGGAAAGFALPTFASDLLGFDLPEAWAGTPIGANDGILVTITLAGGVDGFNTVVPITDSRYYSQRGALAIPASSALPLDGQFGLHPRLPYVKQLWDRGQLAIVHGVGNPGADLSHFTSLASWMHGSYAAGTPSTGWMGRWLDGLPADEARMAAISVGVGVTLQLTGATRRGLAVAPAGWLFGGELEPPDQRMYDGFRAMAQPAGRGRWHDMFASVLAAQIEVAGDVAPILKPDPTGSELEQKLITAARLINADLGFRAIDVTLNGFDTHDTQPGKLADLLTQLDTGLRAFFEVLLPTFWGRTTVVTLSEFGRTSYANGSAGTDHGTANVMMVLGPHVRGGHYGAHPSLNLASRWDRIVPTTDYRNVLGTCIDRWLGGDAAAVLQGSHSTIDLFRSGPGESAVSQPPLIVQLPSVPAGIVPLPPTRVFDTRNGLGGRTGPLGAGQTWTVQVAGRGGVPADATAVVLNLTGVHASAATFVTAWPNGARRPTTSNLNLVPGPPAANFAVVALGVNGAISLFNNAGTAHLVGDVTGYVRGGNSNGITPLPPARLLDTRNGTGGRLGAVPGGSSFELQVAGREGVPGTATAVLLNLTAVRPTQQTYLSVYPSGTSRPTASSLNAGVGDVRANLVMCMLGAGGRVTIYNNSGMVDVVADVLGAVVPGASPKFVALSPSRILDTRSGINAPRGKVGQQPLVVKVVGKGGVPSTNVSAVVLNVTGVRPTTNTYLTVWPTGRSRPTASNVNIPANLARPNGVTVPVGPDGCVQLYNNGGVIDLVADVIGYVTT